MTALRVISDIGGIDARFAVAERGKYSEPQHLSVSKYATLKDAFGEGKFADPLLAAYVTDRAIRNDPTYVKAFEVICSMLATVAGNLALTIGATVGIYIAVGILLRFKQAFASFPFPARFENKGRFQDYLRRILTCLILEESPALLDLLSFRSSRDIVVMQARDQRRCALQEENKIWRTDVSYRSPRSERTERRELNRRPNASRLHTLPAGLRRGAVRS